MDEQTAGTTGTPASPEATPSTTAPAVEPGVAPRDQQPASDPTPPVGLNEAKTEPSAEDEKPGNEWLGVPENGYSDEGFDLPEGLSISDGMSETLAQTCAELGVSQKGFAQIVNKMVPAIEAQKAEFLKEYRNESWKSAQQDPEIGGSKFEGVMNAAKGAYSKFASPELQEILRATGLDCHPAVIKHFYGISQQLSQDSIHRGGSGQGSTVPNLANFFNNSKMR